MNAIVWYLLGLIVLILVGCNLPISFLIVSLTHTLLHGGKIASFISTAYSSIDSYTLLAVPLFIVGGNLMGESGIADRLVAWCEAALKKVKGGLGCVIPLASMLFGMLTGSGSATVATVSSLLADKMEDLGWDKSYVGALVTASSPLGYMIPPNMNAILFATVCSASVAQLFLCSIIPGILWGIGYMILNFVVYKKWYHPKQSNNNWNEEAKKGENTEKSFARITLESIPAWIMAIIILGGIFSGMFSPTEAGAIAALYAIVIGCVIYRTIRPKKLGTAFRNTGESIGMVLIMVPMVNIFTNIVIKSGATTQLTNWMLATFHSKTALLLVIDIIFVLAGFFFDASVLTLVLPPILMPTMTAMGVSSLQFGCIVFCAIGIGAMTPPVASNLYLCARVCKIEPMSMVKPLMPMLFCVAIPVLLLVTFIPALSMWLPHIVYGI